MANVFFRPTREFTASIDGISPLLFQPGKDADGKPLLYSVPEHLARIFTRNGWGKVVEMRSEIVESDEEDDGPDIVDVPQVSGDGRPGTSPIGGAPAADPEDGADAPDDDSGGAVKRRRPKKKET